MCVAPSFFCLLLGNAIWEGRKTKSIDDVTGKTRARQINKKKKLSALLKWDTILV